MMSENSDEVQKPRDKQVFLFDGGTGREIERCGGPFRQPEWSALALYEAPDIVQRVHESFLQAGASAITTNTYAVVPFHLGQERYDRDKKRLLDVAIDVATRAIQNHEERTKRRCQILGSIPPLCGSYEPDRFDAAVAGPILRDFLTALVGRVDVLLLETVGSVQEAAFYLGEIDRFFATNSSLQRPPVWLSLCIKTYYGHNQPPVLMTGETLNNAVEHLVTRGLLSPEKVSAILVNCCDIRLVTDCLDELRKALATTKVDTIQLGTYPNAFGIPPPDAANQTLREVNYNITPEIFARHANDDWIRRSGATVLGGCCGVGPEHIAALAKLIQGEDGSC